MHTSDRAVTRHAIDAASERPDHESDAGFGEHPDDWHEDRLSLAIRVIEALGLRPVGTSAPASALH